MAFAVLANMFLNSPTIAELQMLDLSILIAMRTQHTVDYLQFIREEGFTTRTVATQELLENIEKAIQTKLITDKSVIQRATFIPTGGDAIPESGIQKPNLET